MTTSTKRKRVNYKLTLNFTRLRFVLVLLFRNKSQLCSSP